MANATMRADGTYWLDKWRQPAGAASDYQAVFVLDEQISQMVANTAGRYMAMVTAEATKLCELVDDRYPHVCPRCSGPAYVGAVEVDCAGGCK